MTLRAAIEATRDGGPRWLWGCEQSLELISLANQSCLGKDRARLHGRNVLVLTDSQLAAAAAMIDLDGHAAQMLVCPPDVKLEHLDEIAQRIGIDAVVVHGEKSRFASEVFADRIELAFPPQPLITTDESPLETVWLLLTSGTTGAPKVVQHTLASLVSAIAPSAASATIPTWATFYDIRRYGGMQIFLRAVTGRGSMVLSDSHEPVADYIARLAGHGATHVSGTPSHWRRALMNLQPNVFSPPYVRLSGEIADQKILDDLQTAFPSAKVEHAFASTEAGVGFVVSDGKEGFPLAFTKSDGDRGVAIRVSDGTLRLKSSGNAAKYVGNGAPLLRGDDGFVDTGDIVELRGERYHFVGRIGGIINIGGLKVHPEEIESVINAHKAVRMSLVKSRRNAFTGAVVVADIVLRDSAHDEDRVRDEILDTCRHTLAKHKVPALLRFVPKLDVAESGKLSRAHA